MIFFLSVEVRIPW